jgi:hypothetical protein
VDDQRTRWIAPLLSSPSAIVVTVQLLNSQLNVAHGLPSDEMPADFIIKTPEPVQLFKSIYKDLATRRTVMNSSIFQLPLL